MEFFTWVHFPNPVFKIVLLSPYASTGKILDVAYESCG